MKNYIIPSLDVIDKIILKILLFSLSISINYNKMQLLPLSVSYSILNTSTHIIENIKNIQTSW